MKELLKKQIDIIGCKDTIFEVSSSQSIFRNILDTTKGPVSFKMGEYKWPRLKERVKMNGKNRCDLWRLVTNRTNSANICDWNSWMKRKTQNKYLKREWLTNFQNWWQVAIYKFKRLIKLQSDKYQESWYIIVKLLKSKENEKNLKYNLRRKYSVK